MEHHDDIPFALIFNSDIYTPPGKSNIFVKIGGSEVLSLLETTSLPGALRNISRDVWDLYEQDPKLCIARLRGFTAFAITKRALRVLGFFDENIFPAYYEDNDIEIRLNRAVRAGGCSPIQDLASAPLQHNNNDHYVR